MTAAISDQHWENLSRMVAERTGLHFTRDRWPDLKRGIGLASRELGFHKTDEAIRLLLAQPLDEKIVQVLAKHLTVGETYFFRDPKVLDALATKILPPLIEARRATGKLYLNIWSAACCSGEEPYSLAILLERLLPDRDQWQIKILATDINAQFLAKAEAGVFSRWSFRGSSEDFVKSHFSPTPDRRFAILPKYREMVRFSFFNLIEEASPPFGADNTNIDVIFCRNVLMYFSSEQCLNAIGKLKKALAPGGWLISSAAEAGPAFAPLQAVSFPGAMAYWKVTHETNAPPKFAVVEGRIALPPKSATRPPSPKEPAMKKVVAKIPPPAPKMEVLHKLAQRQADQGKFAEALKLCDEALALDKMSATLHYLRGAILQEQGELESSIISLRRALYLNRELALGHFALGTVMGRLGRGGEQARYFGTALQILEKKPADEALVEFSGMTAGRLAEMIRSIK